MRDLLEYLARGLVEHPDQVRVNEVQEDDGALVLELSVADDDYGNVIGRGGRTAAALRNFSCSARARSSSTCPWMVASSADRRCVSNRWLAAQEIEQTHRVI